MKIEEGKYYRTRDGRKVGPMRSAWTPNGTQWWFKDGDKTKLDLIAEWTDEPEPPTPWKGMTDAEKGALLLAYHRGQEIEVFIDTNWTITKDNPIYSELDAYRIKPSPVVETVAVIWDSAGSMGASVNYDKVKSHRLTFTTKDGKPATGTFTNEAGDVITMEKL